MIKNIGKIMLIISLIVGIILTNPSTPVIKLGESLPRLETGTLIRYPNLERLEIPIEWSMFGGVEPTKEELSIIKIKEPLFDNAVDYARWMTYDLSVGETTIKKATNEMQEQNADTVGWILIPKTKINYPIMYRRGDENYYLDYNIYGKKSASGAIYLDNSSWGQFSDVTLVHGHSMRNRTMFWEVLNYKEQKWAEDHLEIYVYNGQHVKEYRVFASVIFNASSESLYVAFHSETERKLYFEGMIERSKIKIEGNVNFKDVLVLNTCSYEFDNARCLVFAQLVAVNGINWVD